MENTSWDSLAIEIVEKILLDVPTYCLSFNKPWVCKLWTSILLQPKFWIRKLKKSNITINKAVQSVLTEFERNIQVACLYHACLYEEHNLLKTPLTDGKFNLPSSGAGDYSSQMWITNDFKEMLTAAAVLVTRSGEWVSLKLDMEIIPVLPLLLKLLSASDATVVVYDDYGFWNCSPRCDYLQILKGPNEVANIWSLRGCVSTLEGLTQDVNDLKLSIAVDGNNIAIDPGISSTENKIKMMHIKAGTDLSKLSKLTTDYFSLIVSGLEPTHITWMTDAAKTLYPNPCSLILLCYKLNKNSSEQLLQSMAKASVEPISVICSSSTLNADDVLLLNGLAAELWTEVGDDWFVWYESNEELIDDGTFQEIFWDHES